MLGSSQQRSVDVRVVAATNRSLAEMVRRGDFREDLLFRINAFEIHLPPLRARSEDIPMLATHLLSRFRPAARPEDQRFSAEATALLQAHTWPGNVRELQNIMTRACVLNQGRPIRVDEIRPWLAGAESTHREMSELPVGMKLDEVERRLIVATLEKFGGHRAKTAEALGIGVRTLSGKLRTYGFAPREKDFAEV